uniref:RRM domain-containing protein n=1 Tax=Anopheles christyi TaxID=43041 RepID=A0A182JVU8_9DIPT
MGETKQHEYYFGNLPKTATEDDLRTFLKDYGEITGFEYRLAKCSYCPTKIAYVKFTEALAREKELYLKKQLFKEKRLFVASTKAEPFFTPLLSVVVRYLNEHIIEEDLYTHFEAVGDVECVQKPSQNYAYISFKDNASIKAAMEMKQTLKGIQPYIVEVRRKISMFLEHKKPVAYASLRDKCDRLDLVYDPAAEHETTLLVTNIPRNTEEDEVVEFLGRFGKIIDWEMQKSASCVMSNIGYVTYQQPKMARTAFLHGSLNFQGFAMEVYNRLLGYTSKNSAQTVIILRTNLTNDEIFETCSEHGRVEYIQRIDAVNYNTIVRLETKRAARDVSLLKRIAGESVTIRAYSAKRYITPTFAHRSTDTRDPPKRLRKESMLLHINEIEERKNMSLLPTALDTKYFNPNPQYYRNEVQVWNSGPKQGLIDFREYFKKYGTVINLRELKEHSSSPIGVVYLSFETKLEAKRVCKLNNSFMCSRRLVILMADRCIVHDPKLCVKVCDLTEEITDEDVYDRFSMIGDVKYVFRPMVEAAIVCMAKEKWQSRAKKVMCVGRFYVTISSLLSANNQQQGMTYDGSGVMQNSAATNPSMSPGGASGASWYGAVPNVPMGPTPMRPMGRMGPMGPMGGPIGFIGPMGPMGPMGPGPGSWIPSLMTGSMNRPAGPMSGGPMQLGGQEISPRMRGLMQTVEAQMMKCKNFKSLSMANQFNLVYDIVNQCITFPYFLSMNGDDKIRYLINGSNGFHQLSIFTLFTYPEQLQMLSIIEDYYRSTSDPGSLPPPAKESTRNETALTLPNTLVVLTQDKQEATVAEPAPMSIEQPTLDDNDIEDDDDIPPAPSPPPAPSFRSRSPTPSDDDVWICTPGSINGSAQKRLLDRFSAASALKKRAKTGGDPSASEKTVWPARPFVQVSNLPKKATKQYVGKLFSHYGKVEFVSEAKSLTPDSKTMILKFETMYQAYMALEQHLKTVLGRVIRVTFHQTRYKPSTDRVIGVTCNGPYSEVEIFDTFKSCGKITYMKTIGKPGNEVCVLDFEQKVSATAALKITYLHNGNRCKAVLFNAQQH